MKKAQTIINNQVSKINLLTLEQKLQKVSDIRVGTNAIISSGVLTDYASIYQRNKTFIDNHQNANFSSIPFNSSVHQSNLKYYSIDFSRDFNNFKKLSDFTDLEIRYNIEHFCYSRKRLNLAEVRNLKNKLYEKMIAYRNALSSGINEDFNMIDGLTYENNDTFTDVFHSFEFQMRKKMYELAQKEGKFLTSTIKDYFIMQAANNNRVQENIYVDKDSVLNLTTEGKSSFDTKHELVIATAAASVHDNYVYYITCDKDKKDIDIWLTGLGYTEVGFCNQSRPDLVVIDYIRMRYIYFDIKNCTAENVDKFLSFKDQFLVFFGHLNSVDKLDFINKYKSKQFKGLLRIINDPKSDYNQKSEAQPIYNKLVAGHFTDEEILNLDPFVTVTSPVVSTENILSNIIP